MSYKQKDNSGVLFKNDKKTTDNQPDYTGNCLLEGKDYFMSAWIKKAESGRAYMSFSFTAKTAEKVDKKWVKDYEKEEKKQFKDDDSSIPF